MNIFDGLNTMRFEPNTNKLLTAGALSFYQPTILNRKTKI